MHEEKETESALAAEEQNRHEVSVVDENAPLTREQRDEIEEKVNEILDKIRPYIQHDGGDVELLGVDENNVAYVTFLGACAGCMMAGEDFSSGIRLLLLDEMPDLREVVLVG